MIKKKLLGILFVMALCLISFSVTASAESAVQTESSVVQVTVKGVTTYYDNFDDAFDKMESVTESSVKLLADCWRTYARESTHGFRQKTVIDLNGHTLSFIVNTTASFLILLYLGVLCPLSIPAWVKPAAGSMRQLFCNRRVRGEVS